MWELNLGLFVLAVSMWLLWRKKNLNYFKNLNIPGPEPNILFGNFKEILSKGPMECHKEWIEKHGKVFGYFLGMTPILMVADADLLKNIQQKNFHNFANRPGVFSISSMLQYALTSLKGKKWKSARSIITPSFTTSKLKQVSELVNQACDEMMDSLASAADTGKAFDIYKHYQRLTMDVIGRAAFGIQTNVQKNENDPFLKAAKAFLSIRLGIFSLLVFSFPEIRFILAYVRKFLLMWRNQGKVPEVDLADQSRQILKERRNNPQSRRQDLLQLMIDAEMSVSQMRDVAESELAIGEESDKRASDQQVAQSSTSSKGTVKMTDAEIIDNSVLFFLAGYETTSTTLAFVTHFLVNHPDIQEKTRNEIIELLQHEGKLDYVAVQKLRYMDQVINESIRIYPPIYLFVNREAAEDIDYGSVHIKSGMTIQVPVHSLHHDESLWQDPEEFDPDRFAPENKSRIHPMAWQPFGAGPRNCVGMRFAQMEAKMAIAKVLQKYKIVPGKETEKHPLELNVSNAAMRPNKGIWIRLEEIQ